jgi:hypothetical protein
MRSLLGGLRRRVPRLVLVVALLFTGLGAAAVAEAPSAFALGAGRVCVFYYPYQGGLVGHTAWAFSVPGSNTWVYGSGDGSQDVAGTGWDNRPVDADVWVMHTNYGFADVVETFRTRWYTAYSCKNTPTSAVGAAQTKALNDRNWDTLKNNCAQITNDILNTYFGGTFPVPYASSNLLDTLPVNWFGNLQQENGFEAATPLWMMKSGMQPGFVEADGLNMRTAASLSASVERQTGFGSEVAIVCWKTGPSVTATWPNGATYSTDVWDGVADSNSSSKNDGTRAYVSDAWMDTGGDTSTLVPLC